MQFLWGFISGLVTGFLANYFYDLYKTNKRGNTPYLSTRVQPDVIFFEGIIRNSETSQIALSEMTKKVEHT
jgi:hypothetical protein